MHFLQCFSFAASYDDPDESTDMFLDEDLTEYSVNPNQTAGSVSSVTQDGGK